MVENKKELQKLKKEISKIKKSKTKSKKLFKKPIAKPIKKLSATKLIEQMGKESSGRLVREIESPYVDPVQDTRSLFFKESYSYEKRKRFGGFF